MQLLTTWWQIWAAVGVPLNSKLFKSFCVISYDMEYPFDPFESAALVLSPSRPVCPISLLAGRAVGEIKMSLALCSHCLAPTEASLCY